MHYRTPLYSASAHAWPVAALFLSAFMVWRDAPMWVVVSLVAGSWFSWLVMTSSSFGLMKSMTKDSKIVVIAVAEMERSESEDTAKVLELVFPVEEEEN